MTRLWRYLKGRRAWAAFLILVGTGNAAAQTGGWLLVRNAIDKGIRAGNEHHLMVVVLIYLAVAVVGWILQAVLIRGLAGLGQRMVLGMRRENPLQHLIDGRIVESGRPAELVRAGGPFAELFGDEVVAA